jgi:hypothetical protein
MATTEAPIPYRVVFSAFVERRLLELSIEATRRGDGPAFATAAREFRRRLAVYPQFGDPLIDLTAEPGVFYNGIIPPLSIRYGVYEGRRLVLVGALPVLLPVHKPDAEATE